MARKRYSDEDVLKLLREIDVHLHDGLDVVSACRKAGISDKSYYYWRKKFGGLSRSQVSEMKSLKKENERLKKIGLVTLAFRSLNSFMRPFVQMPRGFFHLATSACALDYKTR